jgi:hypothetical protein
MQKTAFFGRVENEKSQDIELRLLPRQVLALRVIP